MWNEGSGNNFIRLLDEKNTMKRHYNKLKEIKRKSQRNKFVNQRYEKSLKKPKRHTKAKINRAREIYRDNKKILGALDRISKKWGVLSPQQLLSEQVGLKLKSLGFKKKSNQDMIKENIRYLEKMKAVKPVYNKKMFEKEKNDYLSLKKNLNVSNGNYRKVKKENLHKNTKEMSIIRKKRPKSAMAGLKRRSQSAVQLNTRKVVFLNGSPRPRFYGMSFNRRPRSSLNVRRKGTSSMISRKPKNHSQSSSKIFII